MALAGTVSVTYKERAANSIMTANPSDSTFTRHYRDEVKMLLSGIDCVLNGELAIYCSSELTTGRRLYDILGKLGLKTALELEEKMGKAWCETNILRVNIGFATEFAKDVRAKLRAKRDNTMVITPAPFDAPDWNQTQYLDFWKILIRTRIKAIWFNENWQFSNGCTFEMWIAAEAGVPTFDRHGNPLSRDKAIKSVEEAIRQLRAEGFDTPKLDRHLKRLRAAPVHPEKDSAANLFSEKSGSYLPS